MDLNQPFNLEDEEILHEEHEDIENIQVEEEYEDMVNIEIGSNVEQPEDGENELEQGELPDKPFEKSPKELRNIARVGSLTMRKNWTQLMFSRGLIIL